MYTRNDWPSEWLVYGKDGDEYDDKLYVWGVVMKRTPTFQPSSYVFSCWCDHHCACAVATAGALRVTNAVLKHYDPTTPRVTSAFVKCRSSTRELAVCSCLARRRLIRCIGCLTWDARVVIYNESSIVEAYHSHGRTEEIRQLFLMSGLWA